MEKDDKDKEEKEARGREGGGRMEAIILGLITVICGTATYKHYRWWNLEVVCKGKNYRLQVQPGHTHHPHLQSLGHCTGSSMGSSTAISL